MSNERLYSEAEAVEIIQRALNDSGSEAPAGGLTQNDLWRIAEEAGATREQFDASLAAGTTARASLSPSKNPLDTKIFACTIDGELDPDDFIIIEEHIPETFGGKIVKQEGRSVKIRIDVGCGFVHATVASRKGQTSIRVFTASFVSFFAGIMAMFLASSVGMITLVSGHNQPAFLVFLLAPFIGLFVAIQLSRRVRKSAQQTFDLLTGIVSDTLAKRSAEWSTTAQTRFAATSSSEVSELQQGS